MPPPSYTFVDPSLVDLALTHASTEVGANNERLEFLGDAVLDLVVAETLFHAEPERSEGVMTEQKARTVSRDAIAGAARDLGLEERARLGHGMHNRKLPKSVLANLYEAYVGAVYLDGGLEAARAFVLESLADALARASEQREEANPKQELQRLSQLQTGVPPVYTLLDERGHAHSKAFLIAAEVDGRRFPSAWGRTRKEAERWAAHEALLVLGDETES